VVEGAATPTAEGSRERNLIPPVAGKTSLKSKIHPSSLSATP
jgi:hypothetical protein